MIPTKVFFTGKPCRDSLSVQDKEVMIVAAKKNKHRSCEHA